MNITYDKSADAAYILLSSKKKAGKTIPVTDSIIIDLDTEGKLIGVEVLDATVNLSKDILENATQLPTPSAA